MVESCGRELDEELAGSWERVGDLNSFEPEVEFRSASGIEKEIDGKIAHG
jgi:hypothetical protein